MTTAKKPQNPNFSSGPCAKRPGWDISKLNVDSLGRSHRSKLGKARLAEAIELSRKVLELPSDYLLGIVPASDTGAFEMAMWSMLGERGVDVFAWESFGQGWVTDIQKQLKISDVRVFKAEYGQIPDLSEASPARDVVFTWNGTTSGVKVPNADWISDHREGLTFCDATSAVFAMDMPWSKLDVTTYSWQKVLGGEGAHGIIILSPRAVKRLENHTPSWPMPKIFQLAKGGKLIDGIFKGDTINTPSMLCVEDVIDALKWAEGLGGLKALIKRSNDNLKAIENWVEKADWIDFLAENKEIRSNTSVCFKIVDPRFTLLSQEEQDAKLKSFTSKLEKEEVAFDIGAYRDAPTGLRIWAGATVETSNLEALFPWLDKTYNEIMASDVKQTA